MVSDLIVWHPPLGAVSRQHHGLEVYALFTNVNVGALVPWSLASTQFPHKILSPSTDCTVSQAMAQDTHTTDGESPSKEASEATIHETPSSFKRSAPTDKNIVDFDPKQCQWNALRDVIYAKQNTNMSRLDICRALKVLYPDEMQFHNMSSMDIEKMAQWWNDPLYPYRHRPLFCGSESYENLGLRLKHALSPTKTARPLAAAPVTPTRTVPPRKKLADIPIPPRHPPRNSMFTTGGSTNPEKTETRRSYDLEAAKQRAVSKRRKVKTKDDFKNEVTRQQSLTRSTNTKIFKITSDPKSTKPLLQNNKASTYFAESSSNPANDYGHSTHSHAQHDSTSELGSLPYHLPLEGPSNAPTLQSKALFQQKPVKKSLMLGPPPQLIGFYSVEYPKLPAKSNPNIRSESGHNPSPMYWNYSTPHSPSGPSSNSHSAKRQALGEKPTNIWQRNGAGYEQLPSISSLFPSEHWNGRENLCLNTSTADPRRIAGQEKNQIIATEHGVNPLQLYGRQARPVLLPPLELSTPSIPSLSSSSVVTPTSSMAEGSRMTCPSTPSLTPAPHSDFPVRKRYSEGTLKYLPLNLSAFAITKRYSASALKFSPSACPWLAIRDVALARDRMDLPKELIALLLSHRYGNAYPFLKQVTMDQVQELWEASRTCRKALYTEQDCGWVEQRLENDLRILIGLRV